MAKGRLGFRRITPACGRPIRTCTACLRAFQAVQTQMLNGLTRSSERRVETGGSISSSMIGRQIFDLSTPFTTRRRCRLGYILIVVLYQDHIQSVVRRQTLNRAAQAGAEAADRVTECCKERGLGQARENSSTHRFGSRSRAESQRCAGDGSCGDAPPHSVAEDAGHASTLLRARRGSRQPAAPCKIDSQCTTQHSKLARSS
jgi:hypothetical protein